MPELTSATVEPRVNLVLPFLGLCLLVSLPTSSGSSESSCRTLSALIGLVTRVASV